MVPPVRVSSIDLADEIIEVALSGAKQIYLVDQMIAQLMPPRHDIRDAHALQLLAQAMDVADLLSITLPLEEGEGVF